MSGKYVLSIDTHIGYLHRGTEKLIEYKELSKVTPYFDRFDYISSINSEQVYNLAIGRLYNITITNNTQSCYTLLVELMRITNHLLVIATHAMDIGALTPFLYTFELREDILYIFEIITGARMHTAIYGLTSINVPIKYLDYIIKSSMPSILTKLYDYTINVSHILINNSIYHKRTVNIGIINRLYIDTYRLTGILARSTGINYDTRVEKPYSNYNTLHFNIPYSVNGDNYSRLLLRVEEIYNSYLIIKYITNTLNITSSDINSSMSSIIRDFNLYSYTPISIYNKINVQTEAPKGILSLFIISNDKRNRLNLASPLIVYNILIL